MLEPQAKTSKEGEIESLRKNIERMETYNRDQKAALDKVNQLVETKQKEIEILEDSNTMLRKKNLAAMETEQNLRKEVLELKTRSPKNPPGEETGYQRDPRKARTSQVRTVQKRQSVMDSGDPAEEMMQSSNSHVTRKRYSEMPKSNLGSSNSQKLKNSLVEGLEEELFDEEEI